MAQLGTAEAEQFLAERHQGVLVTLKASDGRPQLSNVGYALLDGRVRISVTADRAKTVNAAHDPRVSLHVTSADFWTYVVAEGRAELSPIATEPGDETCRALLELFEAIQGPHPDRTEFFRAMVDQRRQQLSFVPTYLYPTR